LALLHLLHRTRDLHPWELRVVHVDHGLHPESGAVAERVAARAAALGLPCTVGRLSLPQDASETVAREARFAWFREQLERLPGAVLLTGHHRDDQVETVLMRVLRGSGPGGLAGMAPVAGRVIRPLLPFARAELRSYLEELGAEGGGEGGGEDAWDDPANRDPRHLRSWLRVLLLPTIRDRLPDVDRALLSLASQARVEREAWDALLEVLPLDLRCGPGSVSVVAAGLRTYDSRLSLALIRALGRKAGCGLGLQRAARVLRLVRQGQSGRWIELGGSWVARLSFERLEFGRGAGVPVGQAAVPVPVGGEGSDEGEGRLGRWVFRWRRDTAPQALPRESFTSWFVPGPYQARWWEPGDRIRPLGGRGSRLVVRCMQERRIGRQDRAAWPVLTSRGAIVWVPGVMRGAAQVPSPGAEALRIDVEPS
jgi:tRNA(Ile)-lysidine synthase